MWVHEHYGVKPDIFTCAKSFGGGVAPLSAAIVKDEIMENLIAYLGSTYGGAPISLAGNMAALDYLKKYNLLDRVNDLSDRIEKRFVEWRDFDNVYQARGWGILKAVDFRKNKNTPLTDFKSIAQNKLFKKGVITMGGGQGRYLSMLRIIPPLQFRLNSLMWL
jgi:4-aminobutyrate aminotransferase-like enzyme